MRRFTMFLISALLLALCSLAAFAQEEFASDEYVLELPTQIWRVISRPDGVRQHAEFVNGDRSDGFLRIRKELADPTASPADLAKRDLDNLRLNRPGYVEGKTERFAGRLNGVTASYEFTSTGKPMAGRIYYLQADNRTIYTLHFTGLRDKLQRIRNQTDSIARTFRLK